MAVRMNKVLLILLSIVMILSVFLTQGIQSVNAATAPTYTTSYYMNTINTTKHYNIGYAIGQDHYNRSGTQKIQIQIKHALAPTLRQQLGQISMID